VLSFGRCGKNGAHAWILALFVLFPIVAQGQEESANEQSVNAVPILTGSTAYFTRVTGGQFQDTPSVSPLLLFPVGDKWLVEAKGNYFRSYAKGGEGYYEGSSSYGVIYAQVDYIANRYITLSGGRFITPFGIYGERLAPNWIRALQTTPLISSVASGSSLGGMLRGGFPVGTENVNFNYAVYFSANNTNHILATDRTAGGRMSFFFPRYRLEIGASFQKLLQEDRAGVFGLHSEWQPERLPLTLRSEFVHQSGTYGSGYWIESVYRLSQVPRLKRVELVGRGQQFFAAQNLTPAEILDVGPLAMDTTQGDAGLNYYIGSDVRASASYGRQFVQGKNANLWVIGMTYRFIVPLGPKGNPL
jgi:hypothetical protein